jgi:hypothetical protein
VSPSGKLAASGMSRGHRTRTRTETAGIACSGSGEPFHFARRMRRVSWSWSGSLAAEQRYPHTLLQISFESISGPKYILCRADLRDAMPHIGRNHPVA